ncbi:hypothetical protein SAMN05216262_12047 [Colwellia chukchiensis]|uniref:Uncharacterized protein n=1 Tax=Colwellia chukchiensis TaxID=641665 RepID=A0A1H7STL8_9GAMM|nr:hypothetical protein [Colwellia chukchiensis]SEL75436.1 hypothetical protein SAMN05216262_12047 [Colwellia chukchiensis]
MKYLSLGLLLLATNTLATEISAYSCDAYSVKIVSDNIEVVRNNDFANFKSSTKIKLQFSSKEKDEATGLTTSFYTGKGVVVDALGASNVKYSLRIERITKTASLTALYVTPKESIISANSSDCKKVI